MIDILSLTKNELGDILAEYGLEDYRKRQIFSFVYKHFVDDIDKITTLKKDVRDLLKNRFFISTGRCTKTTYAEDGTVKYLLKLQDSNKIESVFIPMKNDRNTICVSTQVGCRMGCRFCATGKMGLVRNLDTSEIVLQVRYIMKKHSLKNANIVYMGMGEPLDNYDNVVKSVKILIDEDGINISRRKITLSTCGITPAIEKLKEDLPYINMALSLHSAADEKRSYLMPVNRKYPLKEVMESLKTFPMPRRKRITFEYVMIENVNDTKEDRKALLRLLSTYKSKLNIIPLNKHNLMNSGLNPTSNEKIEEFAGYLRNKGMFVTVRNSKGSSIKAACGMLATKV